MRQLRSFIEKWDLVKHQKQLIERRGECDVRLVPLLEDQRSLRFWLESVLSNPPGALSDQPALLTSGRRLLESGLQLQKEESLLESRKSRWLDDDRRIENLFRRNAQVESYWGEFFGFFDLHNRELQGIDHESRSFYAKSMVYYRRQFDWFNDLSELARSPQLPYERLRGRKSRVRLPSQNVLEWLSHSREIQEAIGERSVLSAEVALFNWNVKNLREETLLRPQS